MNSGILTSAQHNPTLSKMSNPRSAKTISPGRSFDKSPQFSVTNLSDTRPPYPLERNEMAPWGGYSYEVLNCVVVFIVTKCFGSCQKAGRSLNENFKTVYNN